MVKAHKLTRADYKFIRDDLYKNLVNKLKFPHSVAVKWAAKTVRIMREVENSQSNQSRRIASKSPQPVI